MKPFFADTYALFAVMRGDPGYVRRFESARFFRTGHWNLLECLHGQLSQGVPRDVALDRMAPYVENALEDGWEILRRAAEDRIRLRAEGRHVSNIDAVGYALARWHGLPFLTGDPAFRGVPNVEFMVALRRRPKKAS